MLDALLLAAIIAVESSHNPLAVSHRGAKYGRGLMQISEIALADYNRVNGTEILPDALFDEATNIKIGEWVFERNVKYGTPNETRDLLAAYNGGWKNPNYEYADKVLKIVAKNSK